MLCRYVRGVRLKFWENGYRFQRQKVAVDLSHYQNLNRIAKEGRTAVLLEDDAVIAAATADRDGWYQALLTVLQELPRVGLESILRMPALARLRFRSVSVQTASHWQLHAIMAVLKFSGKKGSEM
jgi:hypothetical protein